MPRMRALEVQPRGDTRSASGRELGVEAGADIKNIA